MEERPPEGGWILHPAHLASLHPSVPPGKVFHITITAWILEPHGPRWNARAEGNKLPNKRWGTWGEESVNYSCSLKCSIQGLISTAFIADPRTTLCQEQKTPNRPDEPDSSSCLRMGTRSLPPSDYRP